MPKHRLPGPIAVIDVETTGLFPHRNDRIIEVGVVVIDDSGRIIREFVSLVNPGRDIGSSRVHGLTASDLIHAPAFGDIAGYLVDTLQGTITLAGHNFRFDHQFLKQEFSRIQLDLPQCETLCTMRLAGGGNLAQCCSDYGISLVGEPHHALADAHAAAQLLTTLLLDEPRLAQKLSRLKAIQWPAIPRTGKEPLTREASRRRQAEPPTYLRHLLERKHGLADPVVTDDASSAYFALLDRILEDRHIEESEGHALLELAVKWGLNAEMIEYLHREYLKQLAMAALADGVVTEAERRDLHLVARLLGQEKPDWDQILREATVNAKISSSGTSVTGSADASLVGKRVCFTGELQSRYKGQLITRELAEKLAENAGLIVEDSVTKRLDLLVLPDPHSQSGKAQKARKYGIRIMHELVFWRTIGVDVD